MNNKGFFITVEKTCDGLGGTTQVELLYKRLKSDGYDVVKTFEPGATELGKFIRPMLLDPDTFFHEGYELGRATELTLFIADRAQHYHEKIKPALDRGAVVLSDRFYDSTRVYQGEGRGWDEGVLDSLHAITTGYLIPNVTFVLDGTPYIELDKGDRFERMGRDFFIRVRRKMLSLVNTSNRYVLVNANRPIEVNADEIYGHVIRKMREVGYEGNMSTM